MFGTSIIILDIDTLEVLKYKSTNKIYSKAFITAGVIVVIVYIYLLSILLQKNVGYVLWSY